MSYVLIHKHMKNYVIVKHIVTILPPMKKVIQMKKSLKLTSIYQANEVCISQYFNQPITN